MRIASLRVRLLLAAAMAITVALMLSGLLLARLFVQHVEDRVATELQTSLNQIAAGIELNGEGVMQLASAPAMETVANGNGQPSAAAKATA